MSKLKQYRKTQTIELIEYQKETDTYLVQNTGDSNDRWHVPKDVFESTYEKVK